MSEPVFTRTDPRLGTFTLRPVDPDSDAELLHGWLTHPKSVFWLMGEATLAEVRREFRDIDADPYRAAYLGLHEGRPAFLMERYDPAHRELNGAYEHQPGDVGMHFLVAPADTPIRGFTLAVLVTVMESLFASESTQRVVVEPDVGNRAVHALNSAVGFEVARTIALPGKDAYLSTCTREQYRAARGHQGATQ
ncbi:GNAT family N-acetyltransferase [Halostreptopolyspora alba]|uniref:Lysine N-acyltransferase MbtK n=1 Tax=Halostreptopolyspora alba TaxID=2487137 RepID=A0A3N0EGG8_9ACTN|nr:N-acetyltransferase [Nocardiopsaceae bacterium YIM 96095]